MQGAIDRSYTALHAYIDSDRFTIHSLRGAIIIAADFSVCNDRLQEFAAAASNRLFDNALQFDVGQRAGFVIQKNFLKPAAVGDASILLLIHLPVRNHQAQRGVLLVQDFDAVDPVLPEFEIRRDQ